ncbi:fibrinogen C domain-containing protein 1-A [Ditylenchus destructor]|uniref:Fibrinogen C domain-containing protein 1-A n=1 Tax=Ditylenchus destructor TaxID=166010 RepID=A0AAD4N9A8_9BILA|nr:fibrinogen C domain-containing protein 1-A [Ditylenchus destructor]
MSRNSKKEGFFNPEELDPCIAAETRLKKPYISMRDVKCILCFILFVLSMTLLAAGLMMVFNNGDASEAEYSRIKVAGGDYSQRHLMSHMADYDSLEYDDEKESDGSSKNDIVTPGFDAEVPQVKSALTEKMPILRSGQIHTFPIQDSMRKAEIEPLDQLEKITIESDESSKGMLLETTSSALTETTTTATKLSPTVYSIERDETPDFVPALRRDEVQQSQERVYEYINTEKAEESCGEYRRKGYTNSGVYQILLPANHRSFRALCLMESDYAWTVLQRRTGPQLPFWNNTFEEYANGFGDPIGDHWLGLEKIHAYVAKNDKLQMRIVLKGDLCTRNASRSKQCSGEGVNGLWWGDWDFSLNRSEDNYRMTELKYLRGNLSNADKPSGDLFTQMSRHQQFTTVDRDNDMNERRNEAKFRERGAWWHKDSTLVSLNGKYGSQSHMAEGQSYFWINDRKMVNIKPMISIIMFRIKD